MNIIRLEIRTIEIRSLIGKTYPKNTASLLNRDYVYRKGLDLSKEALFCFVSQRTAKLQVLKVGDLKKILPLDGRLGFQSQTKRSSSNFVRPQLCIPLT